MNILLLTTCICKPENIKDLNRLIGSINQQDARDGFNVKHLILLQEYSEKIDEKLASIGSPYYEIEYIHIPNMISLSKARNLMINHIFSTDKNYYDYVSFPDDDCWYQQNFFVKHLSEVNNNQIDLFYTNFTSSPLPGHFPLDLNFTCLDLIRSASSNTTFYRWSVFKNIGLFDERFGVGAINNGGEDTDFALRAYLVSEKVGCVREPIIGHRDPLPEFRFKYFKGGLGVISKHKFKSKYIFACYIRKLLVGLVFYATGKISLSDFRISK